MTVLLIGGSASGKSEYAEQIALALGGSKLYLATMYPFGEEAQKRIQRHRTLRARKGFNTTDCYLDISSVNLAGFDTVLVECMSNLLANELYREDKIATPEAIAEKIFSDLLFIQQKVKHLVIVSNDVNHDGGRYSSETTLYIEQMEKLNGFLSQLSDRVIEVVYSIPIPLKGELPC